MAFTPIDPNKAEVRITGTAPNYGLDFYIPKGERGDVGPVGPTGPATYTNLAVGVVETGPETAGATGPQGLTGAKGDPGGFVAGTALNTADLNSITTPGLYKQDNSANSTLVANYPKASVSGSLLVYDRVGAGASASVFQQFTPAISSTAGSPFFYIRYSMTNHTQWSPWRMFNSSRFDQTAGRVLYQWDEANAREQLVYGDTGWRDVTASLMNGWTGTSLWLRRIGYVVYIRAYNMVGTSATLNKFYTLPVGFQRSPSGTEYLTSSDGFTPLSIENAGNVLAFVNTSNRFAGAFGNFTPFTTIDAWPTSLPGTAAVGGTIPNT
ncbi:minor tail protein [Arthrobacter phage GantcherGoblin]|nr:minor tail protein [Arthrobacter phage GantcherGoblin]